MSEDVTNEVLDEKFLGLRELLDEKFFGLRELVEERFDRSTEAHQGIHDRLDKLNGQVAKNTEFRVKGSVYMGMIIFVASVLVTSLLARIVG